MYAHCLFCNADLGRNEALEAFPVGRRLAYDADTGRLWVVCSRCQRWNLTPLEERWEAIDQAERLFRATRLRASTDNVGLARVADATDLVRIGRPLRPELAAWRYASTFARRRRITFVRSIAARTAYVGVFAGILALALGPFSVAVLVAQAGEILDDDGDPGRVVTPKARVPMRVGRVALRLDVDIGAVRVKLAPDGTPTVMLPWGREMRALEAGDALRALGPMLASVNAAGATDVQVDGAVSRLVDAGSASGFLARLAGPRPGPRRPFLATLRQGEREDRVTSTPGPAGLLLHRMAPLDRLAFEMAIHDEQERRALDGQLADLERAWRDAEEIAAIADSLVLPAAVEDAWNRLRDRISR